ncbi:GM26461 [Drosophila sechellia]|uniref:GM26461 n=1 Tax=Drosophila sechellia TaxID=7238 RepID=B4HES3_DROSE|nr:GM26461 [Drosophila sechellia]
MSEPAAQQQQSQNGKERSKSTEEKEVPREPALVLKDIDIKTELESLVKLLDGKIYKEEEVAMEELHQYLIEDDGSWALGDNFLIFVQRVLRDNQAFSPDTRIHLIRTLAYAALKDDVIIILHQDRRDHTLMNYAQDIDKQTPEEQQAWAMFMCNLFENLGPSEWLLYISEWEYNGQTISNIRVATKVAVHCILSNVFDDIAVELAMAILQFFQSSPNEDQIFRTLKALVRFLEVSQDVPMIIQMIGPHPKQFAGKSERVDELIKIISRKVPA